MLLLEEKRICLDPVLVHGQRETVQPNLHLLSWVRRQSALTVLSSLVAQSHSP